MSDRIGEIRERLAAATPGPWYLEVDGWPVWFPARGQGSLPYWASGIDESEGNPYKPYLCSFETLGFVASAPTDIAYLLPLAERAAEWMERAASLMETVKGGEDKGLLWELIDDMAVAWSEGQQ